MRIALRVAETARACSSSLDASSSRSASAAATASFACPRAAVNAAAIASGVCGIGVSVDKSPDTEPASAGCAFTVPAASVFATLARSVSAAVSACAVFSIALPSSPRKLSHRSFHFWVFSFNETSAFASSAFRSTSASRSATAVMSRLKFAVDNSVAVAASCMSAFGSTPVSLVFRWESK